ncbi:MAG: hypothetical protein ACI3W7_01655 [Oscillospiraceae bacterium]
MPDPFGERYSLKFDLSGSSGFSLLPVLPEGRKLRGKLAENPAIPFFPGGADEGLFSAAVAEKAFPGRLAVNISQTILK